MNNKEEVALPANNQNRWVEKHKSKLPMEQLISFGVTHLQRPGLLSGGLGIYQQIQGHLKEN